MPLSPELAAMDPEELLRLRGNLPPEQQAEFDALLRHLTPAIQPVRDPNHPKNNFLVFLRECVWTVDEARAGEVRKWPFGVGEDGKSWDEYWRVWDEALLTRKLLFVDKTRRTMASNVVVAFDLWLLAGGQDPRWPELMRSDRNRSILIQSKKLEGETGSQAFVAKMETLCRNFEENGGRKLWSEFPKAKFSASNGRFNNGSRVEAVAQGGQQVRGPGSTLIHVEEAGFMEEAQESIETAVPALAGGGRIVVVTTPNAMAGYLKKLRAGELGANR